MPLYSLCCTPKGRSHSCGTVRKRSGVEFPSKFLLTPSRSEHAFANAAPPRKSCQLTHLNEVEEDIGKAPQSDMADWVPLFDENGYLIVPAASPGLAALPLDAAAGAPAVVALANSRNEQAPARARAPAKCSLCFAVGITCTTHTKARCHLNPAAANAVVVEGGPLLLALEHRELPPHFRRPLHATIAPNYEPLLAPVADAAAEPIGDHSDSGSSSDTDAPSIGSGDESGSSDDGDEHAFLPFTSCIWRPYDMQAQVPLENPWYPALRSQDIVYGPEPPPVEVMFWGEVPPFIRSNEKGSPRNIPSTCRTAWQFIDLLFGQDAWERLCTYTNLAATSMPRHHGKMRLCSVSDTQPPVIPTGD
jgi:hypothetical protein